MISEIVTAVTQHPLLGPGKLGIYGISTGGYLALRGAISDSRIDAVASVGGFIDARGFFDSPITTQESMSTLFGKESIEEMGRFIKDELDIKASILGEYSIRLRWTQSGILIHADGMLNVLLPLGRVSNHWVWFLKIFPVQLSMLI